MTVTKNMTHELDRDALKDAVGAYNAFECGSDVDHVRKIIAAYLSAAKSEPVVVKALEWNLTCELDSGQKVWCAEATGLNTTYSIWSCPAENATAPFGSTNIHNGFFSSLDEGKMALQADYESRIRSALASEPANG